MLRSSSDANKFFGVLSSQVAQCQTLLRQKLASQLSLASGRTLPVTSPMIVKLSEALLQQWIPPGMAMKFVVELQRLNVLRIPFDISISTHDKYNHLAGTDQTTVSSILGSSSFACDVIMNTLLRGDLRISPLLLAFQSDKNRSYAPRSDRPQGPDSTSTSPSTT